MEGPYRTDPDPAPPTDEPSEWWQEAEWPSYGDLKDLIAYVGLFVILGQMVGFGAGSVVGRLLGHVDRRGYADSDFMLAGVLAGAVLWLVAGVVSSVWGTSRLRWALVLGSLLACALLWGGQTIFPPHP